MNPSIFCWVMLNVSLHLSGTNVNTPLMPKLLRNYMDKHDAVNRTAKALTEHGLAFTAAQNLHKK
jgi:peptidoglycan biosynthesis protein MviN/MurJ (putative lipid II flippase)